MASISILIVDDEAPARDRLRRLVHRAPRTVLLDECDNGKDAVCLIRHYHPHLVFLDIQLGDTDGFEVLEALAPDEMPLFIFVTAYEQYAVQAFERHALDYLLKPFSDARFTEALERARGMIEQPTDRPPAASRQTAPRSTPQQRLSIKVGSRLVFIDADAIDWIGAEGDYVRLHVGSESYLLRESLTNVEHRLDARQFQRIHRSTVVNVDRIREIVPHFNGGAIVHLHDGTTLKLSRTYRDGFSPTLG